MFSSIEDVVERFAKNNYIASRRIATVIYLLSGGPGDWAPKFKY